MTAKDANKGGGEPPVRPQLHGTDADPTPDRAFGKPAHNPAPLWNNLITMIGMFLAVTALLGLLTFGLFHVAGPVTNPYVDIVGFLVVPGILVLGMIAMPFGILLRSWKLHRRDPEQPLAFHLPKVDLNDPSQRKAAKIVLGGTFVLLPAVGVSSYHGYHFTDSIMFCSQACHTVMEPEAVTYAQSGHARVPCAECHIGSGASWFVKSKLSGTRQVLAVLRNSYSRPIPPAIRHLRPARETCEHCHWPDKFFGDQLATRSRFASDEGNTLQQINMLLKTGGGAQRFYDAHGIHMHVALAGRIEYVAVDEKLQEIPWVKLTGEDGNEVIFRSDGKAHSDPRPEGQVRQMDCMDCHNRPAHALLAPAHAVDVALGERALDPTLPFIKREAVAALVQTYPDPESAEAGIAASLSDFYRSHNSGVQETRLASIDETTRAVVDIYRRSFFPHMNVDWRTYPDNIGHKISPGCYRCHGGQHVAGDGRRISHACETCHTFLNPVQGEGGFTVLHEGEFIHSPVLEGRHTELRCDQCHTGGVAPSTTCEGCHTTQAAFRDATLDVFERFGIEADSMAASVDCESCHDLDQPTTVDAIDEMCMECHDDEEERFDGMLASWKAEAERLMSGIEAEVDSATLDALRVLREAGPLHNIEATRVIVRKLKGDAGS